MLLSLVTMSVFTSCDKDDDGSGNDGGTNFTVPVLISGKWSTPCTPNGYGQQHPHTIAYWEFYSDETMVITDPCDMTSGQLITYSYNSNTKQLTIGGMIVYNVEWLSSTQFKMNGDIFTKVN